MPRELTFPTDSVRGWTEGFEPIVRASIAARGLPSPEAEVLLERLHAVWQLYAPLLFPVREVQVTIPPIPLESTLSPAERAAIAESVSTAVAAGVRAGVRAAIGDQAELIRALLIERLSLEAVQYLTESSNEAQSGNARRSIRLNRSPSPEHL